MVTVSRNIWRSSLTGVVSLLQEDLEHLQLRTFLYMVRLQLAGLGGKDLTLAMAAVGTLRLSCRQLGRGSLYLLPVVPEDFCLLGVHCVVNANEMDVRLTQ